MQRNSDEIMKNFPKIPRTGMGWGRWEPRFQHIWIRACLLRHGVNCEDSVIVIAVDAVCFPV